MSSMSSFPRRHTRRKRRRPEPVLSRNVIPRIDCAISGTSTRIVPLQGVVESKIASKKAKFTMNIINNDNVGRGKMDHHEVDPTEEGINMCDSSARDDLQITSPLVHPPDCISRQQLISTIDEHSVNTAPAPTARNLKTACLVETTQGDAEKDDDQSSDSENGEYVDDGTDTYFREYLENPSLELFELDDGDRDQVEPNSNDHADHDEVMNSTDDCTSCADQEDDETNRELTRSFLVSFKKSMRRSVFLGAISLYGKCRHTLEQYDHLVAMMLDADNGTELPCVTTMRKSIFPRLLKTLFVQSSIMELPTKKSFSEYINRSTSQSKYQTQAVVVLPSSWARMDIRSLHVLREIACIRSCRCIRNFGSVDLRVDSTRHVLERSQLSKRGDYLWVNKNGIPVHSTVGMCVRFHTSEGSVLNELANAGNIGLKAEKYRGESCMAFEGQIVSTLHVRHSESKGIYVEEGLESSIRSERQRQTYEKCINYLRTLSTSQHPCSSTTRSENDPPPSHNTDQNLPQTRRQRQKRNNQTDPRVDGRTYLVPSDHLSIISFGEGCSLGVYVSRFWVERIDDERNFFLFLSVNDQGEVTCTSIPTFGVPVYVKGEQLQSEDSRSNFQCETTGRLSNGMRFYMYRILLYADDFNPRSTLFPRGSVGGLYLSPSGLNVRSRRSQSCIRTVSLTPPGVSTNAVLDSIIDDLVSGSISGFECIDAFGERVKVYLDIMGFIGDYPASSAVVDLKGHKATAPCTVCGFTFNSTPGMSKYSYSTSITCNNSAYMRTQKRTESLRGLDLSNQHLRCLGMSVIESLDMFTSNTCPLLKFASVHNEKVSNPDSAPPLKLFNKDGYFLNLVAPDHLLTGLFKGLLTIVFVQILNNLDREKLEITLRSILSEYGFQTQSVLFKSNKNKLVPGLTMSILYCMLSVLPSVLQSLGLLEAHPAKRMLLNLHRFYSMAFWWPSLSCDGAEPWRFVHGSRMRNYHRSLKVLAANFVKSVQKFSTQYPDLVKHVDRPNAHRLLELAHHTIPLFNHITYICELVFESAHQPLKFFLSRNHTLRSHIYSVHLILAKDWLIRIWSLWCICRDESETEGDRHFALLGLLRYLGGDKIDDINWKSPSFRSSLPFLNEHVKSLLCGTVERRLDKWYHDARMNFSAQPKWILQTLPKGFKFSPAQRVYLNNTSAQIAELCLLDSEDLQACGKALLDRGFGAAGKSAHEQLNIGDVVQVVLNDRFEENKFLASSICEKGKPNFFLIGGFYRSRHGQCWALVKRCSLLYPSSINQLPDPSNNSFIEVSTEYFYQHQVRTPHYYLELKNCVTKVGVIHNCESKKRCVFSTSTKTVSHSENTLDGGRFFLLIRSMGFPPRRS